MGVILCFLVVILGLGVIIGFFGILGFEVVIIGILGIFDVIGFLVIFKLKFFNKVNYLIFFWLK